MGLQLHFDSTTSNFETFANCANKRYVISLLDFDKSDIERATLLATHLSNWLEENINNVKLFAATQLIELKNDVWLAENEFPISEKDFMNAIELESALAFSEGSFEVYFNDNDVFWGHSIRVDVDEKYDLNDAAIVG